MAYSLPGPLSREKLQAGKGLFRHGLRYDKAAKASAERGFIPPAQMIVGRAEGDFVWDLDGNRYIDFQNGWATNPLGNCHPEIIEAVHQAHLRYGYHWEHPLRFELAEKLAEIMPGQQLPRFTFEVSGTEAVESAVHMALCYTKRRHIISFTSSFHGEGLGTKMISGYTSENNVYMEPWAGGVIKAPYPYSQNIPADMSPEQYVDYCLWYLETHIPSYITPADNIAAIIVEPGLAEGGNWIPSPDFIQGIRRICDKHDWLMIVDEVLTGLGRTGTLWGVEHYDVAPDIMVVGKNLSGGIEPCAGVAARDEILGDNPRASAGSTFAGTPAGCAAGLKTLEIYKRDNIVAQAASLAELAEQRMAGWAERYTIVTEVRCLGLLMGISFTHPNRDQMSDDYDDSWVARTVRNEMLVNGVWAICDTEPTVRMYPALNMDQQTFIQALDVIEAAIQSVEKQDVLVGDYPPIPSGVTGF
ncbi:MAG: aminotransferase class III-fold pyridoxal phosphate-dependent enzyme [Porticoccaceae bacterium]|nr:aminotransferase class III-fold pyridoxal phosphate-dependent enzyme [Porticoccaceae bacterium]